LLQRKFRTLTNNRLLLSACVCRRQVSSVLTDVSIKTTSSLGFTGHNDASRRQSSLNGLTSYVYSDIGLGATWI